MATGVRRALRAKCLDKEWREDYAAPLIQAGGKKKKNASPWKAEIK